MRYGSPGTVDQRLVPLVGQGNPPVRQDGVDQVVEELRQLAVRESQVQDALAYAVLQARLAGVRWREIAAALGLHGASSAHSRYAQRVA